MTSHCSVGLMAAALLSLSANRAVAVDDARPWCASRPLPGDPRPPGCAALDAVADANLTGDFRLNCLSISFCSNPTATALPPPCPASGPFRDALSETWNRGGEPAVLTLERVCWDSVETTWDERERAARETKNRLPASVYSPFADGDGLTDAQHAAWTVMRAAEATPRTRHLLRFENDSIGDRQSDRGYTMGMSISGIRDGWPTEGWAQRSLLIGLDAINRLLRADPDGADATATTWWRLGSADFTPRRIKVSEPQFNDTPYASLVSFASGYSERQGPIEFESSIELGILGTNVGREVQTAIHKVCCQKNIPKGWDHQIGDGGSPTFRYHVLWSRMIGGHSVRNHWAYQLRPAAGGELGYYSRVMAGATLALGGTEEDLHQPVGGVLAGGERATPTDHAPDPAATRAARLAAAERGSGFSLWWEYEVSAFAHNELLQGAWTGPNDVKFSYDEIEHVVWRSSLGIELTFIERVINPWHPRGARLYYTHNQRSRELVHGVEDSHTWGGLHYSWEF